MRILSIAGAILLSSTLVPVSAQEPRGSQNPNQVQNAPVQPDRTPQQSNQARGEGVQVGRDWKAQESDANRVEGPDKTDQDHQTVGRDWRAHPESQEKR